MPILPSSQSDELEISLGGAMDVDPPAEVDPWHIDDDDEGAGPSSSTHAPTSSPHSLRTPHRTPSSPQTQTPTHVTLDPASKTRLLLQKMKEEARRKVDAEAAQRAADGDDEMLNLDIPDKLSDSSGDEEEDGLWSALRKGKGKV